MIKTVDLGKRYGKDYVFRHVNINIEPGNRLVCVVGPNGAGKTTLMKICAALEEPTEGEVYVLGHPLQEIRNKYRRQVLYAHQEPLVLAGRVRDNLICLEESLLETLGLDDKLEVKARSLSVGYKKLLTIARVLACRPKIALLDEPTAYLDAEKRARVMSVLEEYARTSLVVWSTHYPPEAEKADSIYEVRDCVVRKIL
jgi:tungstate transport system ATP-binding protein